MKKIFIVLGVLISLAVIGLVAVATLDLNRFGKDHVYVQIVGDGEVEKEVANGVVYETYWYNEPAYTANGEQINVQFSAQKNLRHGAYLMLYMKNGNEVTSYDEIQFEELSKEVQKKMQE